MDPAAAFVCVSVLSNFNRLVFLKANLLAGNPLQALGVAGPSAQQAAEVGAKLSSNVGGFFKSFF